MRRLDVAVLDDLQGGEQLAPEVVAPPAAVADERRQRLHERTPAEILAEIGLDAPDARDDVAVDPEARFRGRERLPVLAHGGAPIGDALVIHEGRDVVPDRRLELGLIILKLQHLEVGLEPARGGVERLGRDAAGRGLLAQAREAAAEVGLGERRRGQREQNREGNDDSTRHTLDPIR
jgi:hypothetical protein